MFKNIGKKIKTLAQVICWIGIVCSVLSGIGMMVSDSDMIVVGILMIPVGALASWIGSFMLYGFGELVENSTVLAELAVKRSFQNNQ